MTRWARLDSNGIAARAEPMVSEHQLWPTRRLDNQPHSPAHEVPEHQGTEHAQLRREAKGGALISLLGLSGEPREEGRHRFRG